MNVAHHRLATVRDADRQTDLAVLDLVNDGSEVMDHRDNADLETVYLRACSGGQWSVHLGPRLILVTEAEEEAFHAACTVARCDDRPSRPMLLLSGPSALHAALARHEACHQATL